MIVRFILGILLFLEFYDLGLTQTNYLNSKKSNIIHIDQKLDIQFPKDHDSHQDYQTEWWYITANLANDQGDYFGIQWTLFRSQTGISNDFFRKKSNLNPWISNQVWMAHAAVTSENSHFYEEKFARGGTGQAGVNGNLFSAWIDDWEFSGKNDWTSVYIKASGENFTYNLNLKSDGPIILNGRNGLSIKTKEGHHSLYYSQPFFNVKGKLKINGETFSVKGKAWADREWSNAILGPNHEGWDWVALHLNDGAKLMLFRVRSVAKKDFYSGTYISNKKEKINLYNGEIEMIPIAFNEKKDNQKDTIWMVPTKWRIIVKNQNIDLIIDAINENSFINSIVPYWEGPVWFKGTHKGVGYLEMTGY